MTTPNQILSLLAASRCTTAALSASARVPFLVAEAMVQRLAKEGLAVSIPDPNLDLWDITEAGKARAESLQVPA